MLSTSHPKGFHKPTSYCRPPELVQTSKRIYLSSLQDRPAIQIQTHARAHYRGTFSNVLRPLFFTATDSTSQRVGSIALFLKPFCLADRPAGRQGAKVRLAHPADFSGTQVAWQHSGTTLVQPDRCPRDPTILVGASKRKSPSTRRCLANTRAQTRRGSSQITKPGRAQSARSHTLH